MINSEKLDRLRETIATPISKLRTETKFAMCGIFVPFIQFHYNMGGRSGLFDEVVLKPYLWASENPIESASSELMRVYSNRIIDLVEDEDKAEHVTYGVQAFLEVISCGFEMYQALDRSVTDRYLLSLSDSILDIGLLLNSGGAYFSRAKEYNEREAINSLISDTGFFIQFSDLGRLISTGGLVPASIQAIEVGQNLFERAREICPHLFFVRRY